MSFNLQEDIKNLHSLEQELRKTTFKINGKVTPEYRIACKKWSDFALNFQNRYGVDKLIKFNILTSLKSRLQKIK